LNTNFRSHISIQIDRQFQLQNGVKCRFSCRCRNNSRFIKGRAYKNFIGHEEKNPKTSSLGEIINFKKKSIGSIINFSERTNISEDTEGNRNHLRMSEEKFYELLSKIQDNLKKQDG